jgi:deoxyribonuclease V
VARERNRKLHESGNARAVDLRNVVEVHHQLARTALHQILREVVQVLAGFADGQPAVHLQIVNVPVLTRGNVQWWMKRHENPLSSIFGGNRLRSRKRRWRPLHYTMKGMKKESMEGRVHPWNVSVREAREIQEKLREQWEGEDQLGKIRTVAGLDASFDLTGSQALERKASRWNKLREANRAIGCVVVFRYPEMQEIARQFAVVPLEFPYIPGLLSFREIPALLAALRKLNEIPDLLFCDGQGYAHPRRFGLASHLGVLLDKPSIGCAKSILLGIHGSLREKAGSWTELKDEKAHGERIGAAVRTREGVRPIYVSQGHRISLETAIRLTMQVTDGYRIPRPTRAADHFASEIKRKLLAGELCEK